jgi:hypothetical protein
MNARGRGFADIIEQHAKKSKVDPMASTLRRSIYDAVYNSDNGNEK